MHEIVLQGCTPTPLASYLKSLGLLRLLSADHPDTRGYWQGDRFVLRSRLDRHALLNFFLEEYQPTPIMAPWNGGSGFYDKDNKTALQAIRRCTSTRFTTYRECLAIADHVLTNLPRDQSPKGEAKSRLLARVRAELPEHALAWLDAAVSLGGGNAQYPPLLGTGGNDGRLDFTNNFMQRLGDVLSLDNGPVNAASRDWLTNALFATATPGLAKNAIGQFSPGQAGGPNASTGFEAHAAINPWDFVLMIEGSLAFAATTSRRHADDPAGTMSFPFTVRAVGAGSGSLAEGDVTNARGELWLPLWPNAASYTEVHELMSEGRVAFGRKPTRNALDFVRAVHHLGGYRGVSSFQRFGLLMRSGKAYLATPLARVDVSDNPQTEWLDELENHDWLSGSHGFLRFAKSDRAATRFRMFARRLQDLLFALSGKAPTKAEAQALLILLGELQTSLSCSSEAKAALWPIPRLSERWVMAADDDTPSFRIAKALAGLRGVADKPLPLRAQWFPLERGRQAWVTPESREGVRAFSGASGSLPDVLRDLLQRRLWLAGKLGMADKPLDSSASVTTDDMAAFLQDDGMDERIKALLPGLCLCAIPRDSDHGPGTRTLPSAFGLMKLSLTRDQTLQSLGLLPDSEAIPLPRGMLAQLQARQGQRAVVTAWRRLRASGLGPTFAPHSMPQLANITPERAAAALLIPLRYGATGGLARQLLSSSEPDRETA